MVELGAFFDIWREVAGWEMGKELLACQEQALKFSPSRAEVLVQEKSQEPEWQVAGVGGRQHMLTTCWER